MTEKGGRASASAAVSAPAPFATRKRAAYLRAAQAAAGF
jgi:hypothetical protein